MAERVLRGILVTMDAGLQKRVLDLWPETEIAWKVYENGANALLNIFDSKPDLLVVTANLPDMTGGQLINILKGENVYREVSTVICLTLDEFTNGGISQFEPDDFFILPGNDSEFKTRLKLTLQRIQRTFDANPLTKIPGNTSIISYVQKLIDKKDKFSMGYCDLDYFKSFNDKYGFTRGDEVLQMTARIILNTVRSASPQNHFVGHVGGDDFVFVVPLEVAEDICKSVIHSFDSIVPQFYDQKDRKRGGIVSTDRQGAVCTFPLMGISIAVVNNEHGTMKHVGEVSQIAANLKKKAKKSLYSTYIIDRRRLPQKNAQD